MLNYHKKIILSNRTKIILMNPDQIERKIKEDQILKKLSTLCQENNIPIFLVGGFIRDILIGKSDLKDYDFSLPRAYSNFIPIIEKTLEVHFFKIGNEGKNTITYRLIKDDFSIDITYLQGESIYEDLKRRDFTINAIAYGLYDKRLYSLEGSFDDIEKKVIRMASKNSIENDPLRMLRAVRYLCTLEGFKICDELEKEIHSKKDLIENVARERIKTELDLILLSPKPALGIEFLYRVSLLYHIFPELKGLEDIGISNGQTIDVISHTISTLKNISSATKWLSDNNRDITLSRDDWLSIYWACLFHDIGKKDTYSIDESGKIHFYNHEKFSCKIAEAIMERLRFSNQMRERVLRLIKNHMRILNLAGNSKDSAIKRLVNQLGEDTKLLLLLTLADREASRINMTIERDDWVERNCLRILNILDQKEVIKLPKLISGYDIMELGYQAGPIVGEILKIIREKQIEGEINTRDEALEFLKSRFRPHP